MLHPTKFEIHLLGSPLAGKIKLAIGILIAAVVVTVLLQVSKRDWACKKECHAKGYKEHQYIPKSRMQPEQCICK